MADQVGIPRRGVVLGGLSSKLETFPYAFAALSPLLNVPASVGIAPGSPPHVHSPCSSLVARHPCSHDE
jgi:hypothetical protein